MPVRNVWPVVSNFLVLKKHTGQCQKTRSHPSFDSRCRSSRAIVSDCGSTFCSTLQSNLVDQTRSVNGLMECRWTREPFEPREQYGNNLERKPSQMIPNDPKSARLYRLSYQSRPLILSHLSSWVRPYPCERTVNETWRFGTRLNICLTRLTQESARFYGTYVSSSGSGSLGVEKSLELYKRTQS